MLLLSVISGRIKQQIHKQIRFEIQENQLGLTLLEMKAWLVNQVKTGRIEWVLGLTHARHIVLPWSEQHLTPDFSLMLANRLFQQQYLSEAHDYEIRISAQGYQQPLIATFMHKQVLLQLSEIIEGTQFSNESIQPLSFMIWNRFYQNLKKTTSYLHIVAQDRILSIEQSVGNIITINLSPYHPQYSLKKFTNTDQLNYIFNPQNNLNIKNDRIHFLKLPNSKIENNEYDYTLCGVL